MHYYQFNISDYKSHTEHLDLLEDLAYRRMLDWCYLHEKPLPKDINEIAKFIRMRSHSECIANVLQEFFTCINSGEFIHKRVFLELEKADEKSSNSRKAANTRWEKARNRAAQNKKDADAMQTHSERNATQDTLPTTHNTLPSKDMPDNLKAQISNNFLLNDTNNDWLNDSNLSFHEKHDLIKDFIDYWTLDGSKKTEKGWQMAFRKNPIVKRKIVNSKHNGGQNGSYQQANPSRAKQHSDELDRIARDAAIKEGLI